MNNKRVSSIALSLVLAVLLLRMLLPVLPPAAFFFPFDCALMLLGLVDLLVHEAGHFLFGPLGQIISLLGGSLFQFLLPLSLTVYFALRGRVCGAWVLLFWTGENCRSIARYIADAPLRQMPLVGFSPDTIHDWEFLLTRWHLLQSASALSAILAGLGLFLMGTAVFGLLAAARRPA